MFLRSILLFMFGILFSACSSLPSFDRAIEFDPSVSRQVIEVAPWGKDVFKVRITAWLYDKGLWQRIMGPWPAVIGRNGFAPVDRKREGDGRTPSGVYALGTAFGRETATKTGLPYRQATENDLWIDDSASPQYNQWVSGPPQAASYEKMLRSDGLYDLGAVIEYNMDPVVPGHGSAIFLHIWRDNGHKPTAGCVALDEKRLRRLLAWLKADMKPAIVLGVLERIK